jgi:hypothetical protein
MKSSKFTARCGWIGGFLILFQANSSSPLFAADFVVTTPEGFLASAFTINGVGDSPNITLVRGRTYTFEINTTPDQHPFAFGTFIGVSPFGPAPNGVSGNDISSGIITFNVPMDAVDCSYYCSIHGFSGISRMTNSPFMATIRIASLSVGTNLVLTSTTTDTNSAAPIPEYTTNFANTNWFALTVNSNRFFNGTNETFCGKPTGENVFIRIKSQ